MRHAVPIVGLGLVAALLVGCNSTRWNWVHPEPDPKRPAGPTTNISVANLVDYLNENSGLVRSLDVAKLDVTATHGIQSFGLRGVLICEKPQNLRLKITHVLGDGADLGSNQQEFWFWVTKTTPYQYYCAYKDLPQVDSRTLPMPFQPDWIMEALGLGNYGPPERYQPLETHGDYFHLVEKTRSPQGVPVRKIIVIKRWEVDVAKRGEPQVTAFLLLDDATGKEICSAHISQAQVCPAQQQPPKGVVLPRRVELRIPAERTTLALKLDGVTTNVAPEPAAFVRPRMNGIDSFNLATRRLDSAGLVPTLGFQPSASR